MPSKVASPSRRPSSPPTSTLIVYLSLSLLQKSSSGALGRARHPITSACANPGLVSNFFTMALSGGMPCLPILCLILLFVVASGSSESELLLQFKLSLDNSNALSSWNTSTSPCSSGHKANWVGVLCAGGKVWGLQLENMGLKGVIEVDSLQQLPNLRTLSFINNDFDTTWPSINKLGALKSLYLSNNKFSGEIPAQTFQGMQWLKKLHLSHNQFTGAIPISLATLPRLIQLRLEGNIFNGRIPDFQQKKLLNFNVAQNQLYGPIPASLSKMPASSFSGNEGLCGTPLEACESSKKHSLVSIVVVVIVVAAALVIVGIVIFMLHRRRNRQAVSGENPPSNIQKKSGVGEEDDASHHSSRSQSSMHSRKGDNMKLTFVRDDRDEFDLQELLKATAEILGSGCFSSSYKAALLNGPLIVVKRFKQMNNVGRGEFQEHMRRIGRLKHPNLLPLVAYYYRKEEKLLITDYLQNGSLAVRLHGHQALGQPSLDWPIRLKIVKGIVRGLEYLYKELPLIAPHGNLKSSNVLLSQSLEPLLTDYGLGPVINQELAQDIMVIYKSPEHIQHGRITKKTDVWCLGILIVEILTGKFPANFLQQGKAELDLANWVQSVVPEEWTSLVFDKEMGGTKNGEGEMVKLLKIALACCEGDVDKRWDLKEACEKIQEVKERDHDDDFYSSYASEADIRSSRGMSDDFNFSIN